MGSAGLWIRWSWRDLRSRWIQVAVIALIIAVGTGTYAGMTSLTTWRIRSNDASYAYTNMYDLRVRLSGSSFVQAETLTTALGEIEHASWVAAAEERLIVPTQVDASTDTEALLVPGRIVGVDLSDGGPHVNGLYVAPGRPFESGDAGQDVAILERHFADHYGLLPQGEIRLAGDRPLRYIGHALAPEYFMVVTEEGDFWAQANFAAVFTSLETAQRILGIPGAVNDLVFTLIDGADRDMVATELTQQFRGFGVTIMRPEDDLSYRVVTEDPEGDQQFYNVFAVALFAGAVFAAFNLTTRMVEAQRREIGIAMALGVPARTVALRPLLVGAQIALLGVALGVGVGVLIGQALRGFMTSFFPLPVWETPFQLDIFIWVALAGFAVPFLAIAYPVWRAVRIAPIDAIKTGHLANRGGGLAPLLKRVPLPGDSFGQMPFRNLLRAPRRVLLTVLGIAAVITVLIGIAGNIDSFLAVIDTGEKEVLGDRPNRLAIALDSIHPISSPHVSEVQDTTSLSASEPGLRLGGTLRTEKEEFDVFLLLMNFDSELWRPTVTQGALDTATAGLVIAQKAAEDLGVGVGDMVTVRHPFQQAPYSYILKDTELPVLGIHPHPFRFSVYMDTRFASMMGLDGAVNVIYGEPTAGASLDTVKRDLFGLAGVASVQGVAASAEVTRNLLGEFLGILRVIEVAVLGLALLIAFNTASINMDERARENATLFAFGIPVRTVLRMAVVESFTVGLAATAVGFAGGYLMLRWTVEVLWPRVAPEVGVVLTISPETLAITVGLGVLAVAAAPLLTVWKLRRMNIPATLRMVE
ncbi:MAG: ABC transporter permease [Chloroflexi bacterium]|nr:ABC transporter permease [Chloroflexota bacterium]